VGDRERRSLPHGGGEHRPLAPRTLDGGGYPDGLRGKEIPLAARVFAVADTLDAITTDRPYRPAAPLATARRAISDAAGTQFDPRVVAELRQVPEAALEAIRTGIA